MGPYPEPKYDRADFMLDDERAQFFVWYEQQKDKTFHNKDELFAYCMDDIHVLRQACCVFRNLFLKLVKMDPYRQAIISSIFKKVFRTMFMIPDTVGIIFRDGYRMGDHQSVVALQWLAHIGVQWSNEGRCDSCRKWKGDPSAWGTKCESEITLPFV